MKVQHIIRKILSCTANLALFLAMNSISNTCCFLSYQPNVPEDLK